jgi:hypothetical protein
MLAEIISLLNTATDIVYDIYTSVTKAAIAAINSAKPDTWVFLIRNSLPWLVKETVTTVHSYSPSTGLFYISNDTNASKKLDDLVIAEVLDASGRLVLDISETLHNISWTSTPSLYEMVLVSFLSKDILIKEEHMNTYVLNVTTLDYPDLKICLLHPAVKEEFAGWAMYA